MRRVAASTCSNLFCSFDRQLQDLHTAVRLASRGRPAAFPGVYAGLADADLFRDFGNR